MRFLLIALCAYVNLQAGFCCCCPRSTESPQVPPNQLSPSTLNQEGLAFNLDEVDQIIADIADYVVQNFTDLKNVSGLTDKEKIEYRNKINSEFTKFASEFMSKAESETNKQYFLGKDGLLVERREGQYYLVKPVYNQGKLTGIVDCEGTEYKDKDQSKEFYNRIGSKIWLKIAPIVLPASEIGNVDPNYIDFDNPRFLGPDMADVKNGLLLLSVGSKYVAQLVKLKQSQICKLIRRLGYDKDGKEVLEVVESKDGEFVRSASSIPSQNTSPASPNQLPQRMTSQEGLAFDFDEAGQIIDDIVQYAVKELGDLQDVSKLSDQEKREYFEKIDIRMMKHIGSELQFQRAYKIIPQDFYIKFVSTSRNKATSNENTTNKQYFLGKDGLLVERREGQYYLVKPVYNQGKLTGIVDCEGTYKDKDESKEFYNRIGSKIWPKICSIVLPTSEIGNVDPGDIYSDLAHGRFISPGRIVPKDGDLKFKIAFKSVAKEVKSKKDQSTRLVVLLGYDKEGQEVLQYAVKGPKGFVKKDYA